MEDAIKKFVMPVALKKLTAVVTAVMHFVVDGGKLRLVTGDVGDARD